MSQVKLSDFSELMKDFVWPEKCPIAVGVSGGADSLFLVWMMNEWSKQTHHPIVAVTVNHNLRSDSAAEAEKVSDLMKQWGIEHHILTYTGRKPKTRIEEQARQFRYQLLQSFCKQHKIDYLCLAHHSDDQAETFFARLTRGSGVDGLSAIRPVSKRGDLTLIRPILSVDKNDILDTLRANHIQWIEDPMNKDTSFERVRWRSHLADLWATGLKKSGVLLSAKRMDRAKQALDFYTDRFILQSVCVDKRGFAIIDLPAYHEQPDEIKLRVLMRLLDLIGQPNMPVSMDSLERILHLPRKRLTLGQCHIITYRQRIFIAKEHGRQEKSRKILPCQWTKWDRFWVWSNVPACISAGASKKADPDIPFLVQQSCPMIVAQKKLEKMTELDYKQNTSYIETHIEFTPKNKG